MLGAGFRLPGRRPPDQVGNLRTFSISHASDRNESFCQPGALQKAVRIFQFCSVDKVEPYRARFGDDLANGAFDTSANPRPMVGECSPNDSFTSRRNDTGNDCSQSVDDLTHFGPQASEEIVNLVERFVCHVTSRRFTVVTGL